MPSSAYTLPDVSDDELLELEAAIQDAQRRRSIDGLNVFGFGEVSMAVGWPTADPRFIAKRMLPMREARAVTEPLAAIDAFAQRLRDAGGRVLPYETRSIQRPDGNHVGYVVQPIVPEEQLAETVLATETPAAGHPLLVAVRDFVVTCTDDDLALDAQVPNFAWRDGEVWLLDITSPAGFDGDELVYPLAELTEQLVPRVLRPMLAKATVDIFSLYRGRTGALTQVAVFLHRVQADAWVGPALETFNEVLDEPIDPAEVQARWERNVKDFPKIKFLVRLQRAWQEKVRRTPFEYLITDSFTGEVL